VAPGRGAGRFHYYQYAPLALASQRFGDPLPATRLVVHRPRASDVRG
jgi:hypothetical protein